MRRNPAYKLVVFLSSLLLIAILNIPLILAQEDEVSPTPALLPTETPAEVPSEIPTETLLPTFTDVPSETPTLEPSATPVEETLEPQPPSETPVEPGTLTATSPIETATAAATPTQPFNSETPSATATLPASATPTAEALPTEPALTPIFTDNFDLGETLLWSLGNGWSSVPNEGGQALQGTISGESVTFANPNVYNAAVEARFQVNAGEARLSTRVSAAGSYSAALGLDGTVGLYRGETLLGAASVAPLTAGTWHSLRLSAFEDVLRVAIDGVELIALRDALPLPGGAVAFSGRNLEPATLLVDDFVLWIANAVTTIPTPPILTPTLQPSPTPRPEIGRGFAARALNPNFYIASQQWVTNITELMDAISNANNQNYVNGVHVIRLAPGTYTFTSPDLTIPTGDPSAIVVGSNMIFIGGNGLESNEVGRDQTVIERDSSSSEFRLFEVAYTRSLTLYNLTIRNGGGSMFPSGGAIYNNASGQLRIFKTRFENNRVNNTGGAIYNGSGSLEMVQVEFLQSHAGFYGGAISRHGGSLEAQCIHLEQNFAAFGGGALYNQTSNGVFVSSNWVNNTLGATGIGGSIYHNSTGNLDVQGNWWGVPGEPPRTLNASNSVYDPNNRVNTAGPAAGLIPQTETTCPIPNDVLPPAPPPTVTPTSTPVPPSAWPAVIAPNDSVPPVMDYYLFKCDDSFRQTQEAERRTTRDECAFDTFKRYAERYGGSLTWAQMVALLMFGEGDIILRTNVQQAGLGNCYHNTGAPDNDAYGLIEGGASSSHCVELQNDFTYAAVELLYNKCARGNYTTYIGDCSHQSSLFEYDGNPENPGFLGSSQAFFNDPTHDEDNDGDVLDLKLTYINIAVSRLNQFAYDPNYTSSNFPFRGNPNWGICPCGWDNQNSHESARGRGAKWTYSYTTLYWFRVY